MMTVPRTLAAQHSTAQHSTVASTYAMLDFAPRVVVVWTHTLHFHHRTRTKLCSSVGFLSTGCMIFPVIVVHALMRPPNLRSRYARASYNMRSWMASDESGSESEEEKVGAPSGLPGASFLFVFLPRRSIGFRSLSSGFKRVFLWDTFMTML